MVAAGIDIGTNTILMVIAEVDWYGKITVLHEAHEIPRLGQDLGVHGGITIEAMQRASQVLAQFKSLLHQYGSPKVVAVATATFRVASNREKVRKTLEHVLGSPIHVLSGQQEAMLTYAGTTTGIVGAATVIDIGGGSTEIVHGADGRATWAESLPIGCVYLTEQCHGAHPLDGQTLHQLVTTIDESLHSCQIPSRASSGSCLAVAGTATSLACLSAGLPAFQPEVVNGYEITDEAMEFWAQQLVAMDSSQLLALPGIDSRRADILPVGALILQRIMRHLQLKHVTISVKGLRYGALLNALGLM